MQFIDEQNVAGQTLLRLVSRANAIIAELLRLSAHIPPVFKLEDKLTQRKYGDILLDFSYVGKSDYFETKIERDPALTELDLDFKENYLDILKRFYLLFESIYKYITDLAQYVDDVESGIYIQVTLEGLLFDDTGKQLMAEALYLYGVMLLLLDQRIEGIVRERMLISTLRYIGQNELPHIDEVCKLCARTGVDRSPKRPPKYPDAYFARYGIPDRVVEMIIGRLRSDDIYNQVAAYPVPEHRSAALANQAAMLYVILYFAPNILINEHAIMREIVDKHFPDNWVIAFYMGFCVDLTIEWEPYKAAKTALNNTTAQENIASFKARYVKRVEPLIQALAGFLTEGVLVEEFILEKRNKLMACLRDCNVTLRWLMLHTRRSLGKVKQFLNEGVNQGLILHFLMLTAQFEYSLKTQFQAILTAKQEKWDECKKESSDRMRELGEYFSGEKPLTHIKKNEKLQKWFSEAIASTIDSLDWKEQTVAGRKMQQLVQALEEVEQYHQIETNLPVRQFLIDTRKYLKKMLRIVNIGDDVMATFDIVTDASYLWEIVTEYLPPMQESIKRDPRSVLKLRSTFLKLASIMQVPLMRIGQAKSPDLVSVSQYYSGELVKFVRDVLEVIPKSMFTVLREIIDIQTNQLKELPTKLDKDQIKDLAQLSWRYKLSEATYKVSVFTKGVLDMETTFVALVAIDPKQLLEDGIRKELVAQIAASLHTALTFQSHQIEEFEMKLNRLAATLDGFKRSFTYIQDYVNIYGLKIWQEEVTRIINFNVEQECNPFLKRRVHDWASTYQSEAIPIPKFAPVDTSVNFIGRLGRELLLHSSPSNTIFLDKLSAWYSPQGREMISLKTFALLLKSTSVSGLVGLDKLFAFMIVTDMKVLINQTVTILKQGGLGQMIAGLAKKMHPPNLTPAGIFKLYQVALKDAQKAYGHLAEILGRIGQKQLLRKQIANILSISCKLDSNILYSSLEVMNDAVLKDVRAHYADPENHPYPDNEYNALSFELTKYLLHSGLHEPYRQIYITTRPIEDLDLILVLMTISRMQMVQWTDHLGILQPKSSKGAIDTNPLALGLATVLAQFNIGQTDKYVAYLGQYIRSTIESGAGKEASRLSEYPPEIFNVMTFVELFAKFSDLDHAIITEHIPQYLIDQRRPAV